MNPWQTTTSTELYAGADNAAVAQEYKASMTSEDSAYWHHISLAWLLAELAARLRSAEAALGALTGPARLSHDAGDNHFSTAEVEAAEAVLAKARGAGAE